MQKKRLWQVPTIVLLISTLCVTFGYTVIKPQATYAASKIQNQTYLNQDLARMHLNDNGLLQWPFSPSDGPWSILQGYNASTSPDHNCNPPNNKYNCYQRYGFDFIVSSGTTSGKTIYSPAAGKLIGPWAAYNKEGLCFVLPLGSSIYVQLCHIDFYPGPTPGTVTQGQPLGTVDAGANHIHMNLFTSSSDAAAGDPTQRYPVPFDTPWGISGCDYPKDPQDTPSPNGQYSGQAVPCSNQGVTPTLNIQWGSTTSATWSGINLNRPVLVEVRSGLTGSDIFSQSVVTDANGTATLTLNGVTPGPYTVLLKPQGFLRQAYPSTVNLVAGTNSLYFSMTNSGTSCINGQPTGQQLWAGDVDGNNVINSADYTAVVSYFGQTPPQGYVDIDGDNTFDGVDYNIWLRAICFFGGGQGVVVGDGGRQDTPIGQAVPSKIVRATTGSGTISLSPASGTYRVNQTFNVNVLADSGGLQLDGTDIVVHYNPAVLKVTSLTAGAIFPSTPALANNSTTGEISISSLANKGQPVIVSGTLATIQFQVIGSGQTPVTLDFVSTSKARTGMAQDSTVAQVLNTAFSASYTAGMLFVPQNYSTIAQALAAANPGETVFVSPGTYHELLTVPAGVTLQSQNPSKTIIDGSKTKNTAVIYLNNGATLSGFTVQHSGTNFWDAAVWAGQGAVTITNNVIRNSSMGIVRFCSSPPCADTSTVTNNLVENNINTGILIHGAAAQVANNTVAKNHLQGLTFEAAGGQGSSIANILYGNNTGLTAPVPTTLVSNLLWQNTTTYGPNTTPGASDIQADPLFINAATNNYHLHALSPAFSADGTLGVYPFVPKGKAPTKLAVAQSSQNVTLSWKASGEAGYYVYFVQNGIYFGQPLDVGNVTSYTFTTLQAGNVQFAVTSYNAQKVESLAAYSTATVT